MKRQLTRQPRTQITLSNLNTDTLDSIATHAGILAEATRHMTEDQLMPLFREECRRLETIACDELMRRGVIANFEDDYTEQDTERMLAVNIDDDEARA